MKPWTLERATRRPLGAMVTLAVAYIAAAAISYFPVGAERTPAAVVAPTGVVRAAAGRGHCRTNTAGLTPKFAAGFLSGRGRVE